MECYIRIDGKSADELFAAGPIDLLNFFLPEKLGVKKEDVVQITFEQIDPEKGKPYYIVHKDNYCRHEVKKG